MLPVEDFGRDVEGQGHRDEPHPEECLVVVATGRRLAGVVCEFWGVVVGTVERAITGCWRLIDR